MTDKKGIEVDISGALKTFDNADVKIHKAVPALLARLANKGEQYMKSIQPVRTGNLRRTTHVYPRNQPDQIGSFMGESPPGLGITANYAFFANVRSRSPRFIEKTSEHIINLIQKEADTVVKNLTEGMSK